MKNLFLASLLMGSLSISAMETSRFLLDASVLTDSFKTETVKKASDEVKIVDVWDLCEPKIHKDESDSKIAYWVKLTGGGVITCLKSKCKSSASTHPDDGILCWVRRPCILLTVLPVPCFYYLQDLYEQQNTAKQSVSTYK